MLVPGYREDIAYRVVCDDSSPERRREYWDTGAALQATDGLRVTDYASSAAEEYIAGRLSSYELEDDLRSYHERAEHDGRQAEADIVAARIASLLEGQAFALRPTQLISIHSALFDGVLPDNWVGRIRTQNLEKPEPVLGSRSVVYADWRSISRTLDYGFDMERERGYTKPLDSGQIGRFSRFIANVWQTHAFREGNTRTIAVFSELYLRSLGVPVDNSPFIENSVIFRDSLVRANFSSMELGVDEDLGFLSRFFENVALGAKHELIASDLNIHGIREEEGVPYRNSSPSFNHSLGTEARLDGGLSDGKGGAARLDVEPAAPHKRRRR